MTDFEITEVPTQVVAVRRRMVPMDELQGFFTSAFGEVAEAVAAAGGRIAGPPFGWYHGLPTHEVDVAAGFPVSGDVHVPDGGVQVLERPGGRVVAAIHVGPYDAMEATYGELQSWMATRSMTPREDMWEEYLSPPEGDPATWRTRIVTPIA